MTFLRWDFNVHEKNDKLKKWHVYWTLNDEAIKQFEMKNFNVHNVFNSIFI
jgi:hypothetical protein